MIASEVLPYLHAVRPCDVSHRRATFSPYDDFASETGRSRRGAVPAQANPALAVLTLGFDDQSEFRTRGFGRCKAGVTSVRKPPIAMRINSASANRRAESSMRTSNTNMEKPGHCLSPSVPCC